MGFFDNLKKKKELRILEQYKTRAELGDKEAQYIMGLKYLNGDEVEIDIEKGFKLLVKAGRHHTKYDENGSHVLTQWRSLYEVGNCYYNGTGVEKNIFNACKILKFIIDFSDTQAYEIPSSVSEKAIQKIKLWVPELIKSAQTSVDELYSIGYCYRYFGKYTDIGDVKKRETQAMDYFKKAVEMGSADSAYQIAYISERYDKKEALEWYYKAADMGNAIAEEWLATKFRRGKKDDYGIEKNTEKAMYWYKKAAEQQTDNIITDYAVLNARHSLGFEYYKLDDYNNAMKWYKMAMELPDFNPLVNVRGELYYDIACVYNAQGNLNEALSWCRKGVDHDGYADCRSVLKYGCF